MEKLLNTNKPAEVIKPNDGDSISKDGDFMNSKIYLFSDGTIETMLYEPGWNKTRKQVNKKAAINKKAARGESFDYERNRGKTITNAKTRVRRLIKHYKLRYLIVLVVGDESITIKEADSKVKYFRNKLKTDFPIFKTWITSRFYNEINQLCYKILTDIFLSPSALQEYWKHGNFYAEQCEGSAEFIASNFTANFNDKRFQSYKLYSPAAGMNLHFEELYSPNLGALDNYILSNYPGKSKKFDKKFGGGNVNMLIYS